MGKVEDRAKQIAAFKKLGMTDEEIRECLADDEAVERGEKMSFDLTPEQEKNAKKARGTGTKKKPAAYKFETRKRKENPVKRELIQRLFAIFEGEDATITNPERVIELHRGEDVFEITLSQKRKPKE